MKQFIYPELKRGEIVCAVYKMSFDDGSYYIGSSAHLKQRMWGWKFKLESGVDKNYKVTAAFKETTKIVFEILEIVDDPALRKFREDGYIKINFGKPLCLNSASNAYTNHGVKMNPNKKRNTSGFKPIARVSESGEILEKFDCISDAERKYETGAIHDCLRNSRRKSKGMIFRELDIDGNIIPAPTPQFKERKKPQRKKGYHISEEAKIRLEINRTKQKEEGTFKYPAHSKQVIKISNGQEVNRFPSIIEAAKDAGCKDRKNFSKVVSGKRSVTGYYKGYIWKYA